MIIKKDIVLDDAQTSYLKKTIIKKDVVLDDIDEINAMINHVYGKTLDRKFIIKYKKYVADELNTIWCTRKIKSFKNLIENAKHIEKEVLYMSHMQMKMNSSADSLVTYNGYVKMPNSHWTDVLYIDGFEEAFSILESLPKDAHIVICGDYDSDGVLSQTVAYKGFKALGYDVEIVSNERKYSNGMNSYQYNAVMIKHEKRKVDVVITVDQGSGVPDVEYYKKFKENGINVIITDHHQYEDVERDAILINCMSGEYTSLSGCAVIFEFLNYLNLEKDELRKLLPYVAFSLITDVMDLSHDYARVLYLHGMNDPAKYSIGLRLLCGHGRVDETAIGFRIGPLLNLGRLNSSSKVVRFLTLDEPMLEHTLAYNNLVELNKRRKYISQKTLKELPPVDDSKPGVLLYKEGLAKEFVGVYAGNLGDKAFKPAVVLTYSNGVWHGSARAIVPGLDLKAIFGNIDEGILVFYAGHSAACGLAVHGEKIQEFEEQYYDSCELELSKLDVVVEVPEKLPPLTLPSLTLDFINNQPIGKNRPTKYILPIDTEISYKHFGREDEFTKIKLGEYTILHFDGEINLNSAKALVVTKSLDGYTGMIVFILDYVVYDGQISQI